MCYLQVAIFLVNTQLFYHCTEYATCYFSFIICRKSPVALPTTHTNTREVNIINDLMDSAYLVTEHYGMQNSVIVNAQLF